MNAEDWMELIGEAREDQIADAHAVRKRPAWTKWASAAACAVLLIGAGAFLLGRMGSDAEGTAQAPAEAPAQSVGEGGGAGHEAGTVFMSYAGPVFPLTLREEGTGITAERAITYDFARTTELSSGVIVRDAYTLTNPTDEERIVTAVYPIAGDYQLDAWPTITLDGAEIDYALASGSYSGSFRGAGDEHTTSVNLDDISSWEEYQALLADGAYFAEAFAAPPAIDTPVVVYTFSDVADRGAGGDAATLAVRYRYDPENTGILTYGFNGAGDYPETGEGLRDFFIRGRGGHKNLDTRYLIVLGQDISGITTQGYQDGGCEPGEEVDMRATMHRSETTLGAVLEEIARMVFDEISAAPFDGDHNRYLNGRIPFEMYYADILKFFARYGPGGTEPKERYSIEWGGRLEDVIYETAYHERILYLTFPVTIPAGESVALEAEQWKEASFDFDCSGSENVGIDGYDLVTTLGSNLTFTADQRASIEHYERIEIVRENFGFDLEAGITEVALKPGVEHYYLEVREKEATE